MKKNFWIKKNNCAGVTIVELVIYLGILTILLTIFTTIFTSVIDVQIESEATSSVEQDRRFILSRLIYDITRAGSINTPYSLVVPNNQSNNLQITINGIPNSYTLDGNGNLILTNNLGADMLNSYDTSISGLSFARIGNAGGKNTLQITFTLSSRTQRSGGSEVRNFQTTVGIR